MKKKQIARKLLRQRAANPLADMIPEMEDWFNGAAGKQLIEHQKPFVDEALSTMFGYHLMQMSICRDLCLHEASKIRHQFAIGPLEGGNIVGIADEEQLPIESESIDVAILHHTMEYTQRPHQLLKEVSRTILPSGHIIIVSFNPFSFMGLWSLISKIRGIGLWQNQLLSISRMADWLTLMDFTVQSVQYGYYKPPVKNSWLDKFSFIEKTLSRLQLPIGGFYVIVARKDVSTITPVKPKWRRPSKSIIPVMEPSLYTQKTNKKDKLH